MLNFTSWRQLARQPWTIATLVIATLMALPLFAIFSGSFADTRDVWKHLIETVLGEYIFNSLALMVGVGLGVAIVGTGTAWLVTMCDFPGRSIFQWALLLPLAAPSYLLAYTYTDLFDFAGPIQSTLRSLFHWKTMQDYWFPNLRSVPGAMLMFILVLYPYVYLLARSAFLNQSTVTLEASRSLGCTPWQGFLKVALPLARPAIVAGVALALMETLNDYGTVDYFSVPTFTIGIFRTWFAQGERLAASQLALLLLTFIAILVILERQSRSDQRYYQSSSRYSIAPRYPLHRGPMWGAMLACSVPIVLGFGVPVGVLTSLLPWTSWNPFAAQNSTGHSGSDAIGSGDGDYGMARTGDFMANSGPANDAFWSYAYNSLSLAVIAAIVSVILAIVLAYSNRLQPTRLNRWAMQAATLGYAIPGAVIAVGTMVPLGAFDNALDDWMRSTFNLSTGLLLSGTMTALIFAYTVRFLAVGYGSIESSLGNLKPSLDDASRSLGLNTLRTLQKIHLPLIRSGLISAAILVFVDVMKELPVTLIMRPLNYDTLAIRVYNLASDEKLDAAALPALAIIFVGLLPVILLSIQMGRGFLGRQR